MEYEYKGKRVKNFSVKVLPIYKINGKFYFRDKRLGEYRNVKNPLDVLKENQVSLKDFQKPTKEDKEGIYGV